MVIKHYFYNQAKYLLELEHSLLMLLMAVKYNKYNSLKNLRYSLYYDNDIISITVTKLHLAASRM